MTIILLAIAAAAAYAVFLYLCPWRACPRCRGTRITGTGRRGRMCGRCAGTGRTRRIGATAVHRFYWSALGDQLRARRRDKLTRRRQHTQPPDPPNGDPRP